MRTSTPVASQPRSRRRAAIRFCSEGSLSMTDAKRARVSRAAATIETLMRLNGKTCVPRPAGSTRSSTACRMPC
jgi:hypothetical protein